MSYSRMVLEQIKAKAELELINEHRSQRPEYQNILDDAKGLSEQMTPAQAARDYGYMYDTQSPEERELLMAPSEPGTKTYYPDSLASMGSKASSNILRGIANKGIDVPELTGKGYDTLTDYQKQQASQAVSAIRGGLEGMGDMPDLTPSDFEEISKQTRRKTGAAAIELDKKLASQSANPAIAKRGTFNPADQINQDAQALGKRYRAGLEGEGLESAFKQDLSDVMTAASDRAKQLARDANKIAGGKDFTMPSASQYNVDVAGDAAKIPVIATAVNPASAAKVAGRQARSVIGNYIGNLPTEAGVDQAALDTANAMEVPVDFAKRTLDDFRADQVQSVADTIKGVANKRASIKSREAEGARTLGQLGILPGMTRGRSGKFRGVGK